MSWQRMALKAREEIRRSFMNQQSSTEGNVSSQSFPKHPEFYLDEEDRLCVRSASGSFIPLTKKIVFVNDEWGREAFQRFSMFRGLQSAVASTLLCVRKFMHAKTKKGAITSGDEIALSDALNNLRASRGNHKHDVTNASLYHGMSFIDAIDKTFKDAAEAAPATKS